MKVTLCFTTNEQVMAKFGPEWAKSLPATRPYRSSTRWRHMKGTRADGPSKTDRRNSSWSVRKNKPFTMACGS